MMLVLTVGAVTEVAADTVVDDTAVADSVLATVTFDDAPFSVNTVVSEPPSLMLNKMLPSVVTFFTVKFAPLCVMVMSPSSPNTKDASWVIDSVPSSVSDVFDLK